MKTGYFFLGLVSSGYFLSGMVEFWLKYMANV